MTVPSDEWRDGAAYGAALVGERMMRLDLYGLALSGEVARKLALGVANEVGAPIDWDSVRGGVDFGD